MTTPVPIDSSEIAEVREFAAAAREITRSDLSHDRKLLALVNLSVQTRDALAPRLAQAAVWGELELYLAPPPPSDSPDPVERACRKLRRERREHCPTCRRPLPSDRELSMWKRRRDEAIEWHRLREETAP